MKGKVLVNFYQAWAAGFYSATMIFLLPWMLIRLAFKAKGEPLYGSKIWERIGLYANEPKHNADRWIWIHAVSLGETRVAGILMEAMRLRDPQLRFLLTHATATGRLEGSRYLSPRDHQVWQPWDIGWCVQSFLTRFKPHLGLLIETEVWPNLVQACRKTHTPLVLVNARMSEKSFKAASRLNVLSRPAFEGLHGVWAQSLADSERLKALGADVQGVLGSMKFDAEPDPILMAQGHQWKTHRARPMVLLASSRPGEEELFLHEINGLTSEVQAQVLWAIVPRHPQRFDEVAALAKRLGFECFRRSHWVSLEKMQEVFVQRSNAKTLFIGDSLGEMNFYYATAQVCLLGASFLPFGGQNLIEPMACSCPVVVGPYTYNFEKIAAQAKDQGAALGVQNMSQAVTNSLSLLNSQDLGSELQEKGLAFVQSQQGATHKTVEALWPLISHLDS
jgi:3-deoxy-D-manno-octulosonic-acid transferase